MTKDDVVEGGKKRERSQAKELERRVVARGFWAGDQS